MVGERGRGRKGKEEEGYGDLEDRKRRGEGRGGKQKGVTLVKCVGQVVGAYNIESRVAGVAGLLIGVWGRACETGS